MLTVGKTYVFFVPPGWLIGGTIVSVDDEFVLINDAVYLESVAAGHAMISSVPLAKSAKELSAVCTTAWGLPDGYGIRREAILHYGMCRISLASLAGKAAAKAIEEAG